MECWSDAGVVFAVAGLNGPLCCSDVDADVGVGHLRESCGGRLGRCFDAGVVRGSLDVLLAVAVDDGSGRSWVWGRLIAVVLGLFVPSNPGRWELTSRRR